GVSTQSAPGLSGRIILALTPPLLLVVVSLLAVDLGGFLAARAQDIPPTTLHLGTWCAILVLAGFALVDGWLHGVRRFRGHSWRSLPRLGAVSGRALWLALATFVLVLLVLRPTVPHVC